MNGERFKHVDDRTGGARSTANRSHDDANCAPDRDAQLVRNQPDPSIIGQQQGPWRLSRQQECLLVRCRQTDPLEDGYQWFAPDALWFTPLERKGESSQCCRPVALDLLANSRRNQRIAEALE